MTKLTAFAICFLGPPVAVGLLSLAEGQSPTHTIRNSSGAGALLAQDRSGLVHLAGLYALSKNCTPENLSTASSVLLLTQMCVQPDPSISSDLAAQHLTIIRDRTPADFVQRGFVFSDGRLSGTYSGDEYEQARDGAVSVTKVKTTGPDGQAIEGWVVSHALGRRSYWRGY